MKLINIYLSRYATSTQEYKQNESSCLLTFNVQYGKLFASDVQLIQQIHTHKQIYEHNKYARP